MRPILTIGEMREADAIAQSRVPVEILVERAGTAVASAALRLLGGAYGRRVVVVAGKGSNGADGRVAAARLSRRGARVAVIEATAAPRRIGAAGGDAGRVPGHGGVDLVIDAAYGTGFRGIYDAPEVPPGVPVIAVDIPSGVNGDTGEASGTPLRADVTVTFVAMKPGLLQGDGVMLAGRVEVADIGIDPGAGSSQLMEDADVRMMLPARSRDAHKWRSAVAVVAGSPGMTGAAALCVDGAYRAGAGMVRLGMPGTSGEGLPDGGAVGVGLPAQGWAGQALEMAERCRAVVVGPGLGRGLGLGDDLRRLVAMSPVPVVVDADALVALGDLDGIASSIRAGAARGLPNYAVVVTPHDGEAARLSGSLPGPDRISAARSLARATGAVVLLKGPTTAVATPQGDVRVAVAGSPRLATAGTGDVLAGVVGAFMARGLPAFDAASLAAHVHGRAASRGLSEGLAAGDLARLVAGWLSAVRDG